MTEETGKKEVKSRQFIHSCLVKNKFGNAVVVKEKILYTDGTIEPNIAIYESPKRHFYITKERYRTYRYKPEYELVSRLEKYTVFDYELERRLTEVLGLGRVFVHRSTLFKSPYVFGADISIEALIKMKYMDLWPDSDLRPTVGFLDIETSIDTGQIILISYLHDNVVHTAILDSFFYEEVKGQRTKIELSEMSDYIKKNLAEKTMGIDFEYNLVVLDSEIKLIAWIAKRIHASMTDFIQIWNMNFDIPRILAALKKHNVNAADIFCHPSLGYNFKSLNYHEDKRKEVAHFTLRWHWLYSTCASQFVDAMGLYSQCRRTAGFRDKYTLDAVLQDEVGMTKLPLAEGSHVIMQRHHFKDYIVYNIFDVIGLRLLEDKNQDVLSMAVLSGSTPVAKFATQTTRATNAMYHNLIGKGMILSSYSAEDNFTKLDKLFESAGGAVLNPSSVIGVGVKLTV
jgi:hypothetical protein